MLLSSAAPILVLALAGLALSLLPWTDASRQSTCLGLTFIARRVIGWVVG